MDVLNFGSMNIDVVFRVPEIVRAGETLSSTTQHIYPGGKGLNQSVALARAGVTVVHAGKIGLDGGILKQTLEASGANTDFIGFSEKLTGQAFIQVTDSGENAIVLNKGANHDIDAFYIDSLFSSVPDCRYLLLQNEINGIDIIMRKASKKGMKILLNLAPFNRQISLYPIELVDTFFANEIEFVQLTNSSSISNGIITFFNAFPASKMVLTLGGKGAMQLENGKSVKEPAYNVRVVDTTGAGDTFIGYYIAGLIKNWNTPHILQFANRAASLSIQKSGAAESIPYLDEVLENFENPIIP